ncbi:intracellular hyaluronan-binding protein 4-like [Prorops nasuta]|uniref:intracellular hyaluronan-binding protein 4-like n=1 Tax=Prorops nasuta TaxID=863751 RepID=UPI0034CD5F22
MENIQGTSAASSRGAPRPPVSAGEPNQNPARGPSSSRGGVPQTPPPQSQARGHLGLQRPGNHPPPVNNNPPVDEMEVPGEDELLEDPVEEAPPQPYRKTRRNYRAGNAVQRRREAFSFQRMVVGLGFHASRLLDGLQRSRDRRARGRGGRGGRRGRGRGGPM